MDILGLFGMVLTYALTLLLKRNPRMKAQAPLVVSIISTLLGALQAAVAASTAVAAVAGADSLATHASSGGFLVDMGKYAVENAAGSVIVHNVVHKWLGEWLVRGVLGRIFR